MAIAGLVVACILWLGWLALALFLGSGEDLQLH